MTSLVYRLLLWIPDTQELNILYLMLERDCPKSPHKGFSLLITDLIIWLKIFFLYSQSKESYDYRSGGRNYQRDLSEDFVLNSFSGFLVTQIMANEIIRLSYEGQNSPSGTFIFIAKSI